jgi:Transposase DDE domain
LYFTEASETLVLSDRTTQGRPPMHHRIVTAVRQLRQDLARQLDRPAILEACRAAGHSWRGCLLDPVAVVHLLLTQVLNGNTALAHLPRLAGLTLTASAICQARSRLPLAVLQEVLRRVGAALRPEVDATGLWHGHRTFLIDGSSFSMPDTPELRRHFGLSKTVRLGCGFPTARLMALFHAGSGLLVEAFAVPHQGHDMARASQLHPRLAEGDVLVGDRGLCSFAHLVLLAREGLHAVVRMHQTQVVDFTPGRPHVAPGGKRVAAGRPRTRWVRSLGVTDHIVEWFRPPDVPSWLGAEAFAALPKSLLIRELSYRTEVPGFRTREVTLATTLLDGEAYPASELAELYAGRWAIELNLRHLKTTMKMDVLRCKSVAGVMKELTAYCLVYNLVRAVMLGAARRQGVAVGRISFVDGLRWLACARAGEPLAKLVVNPLRPGRFEPRVTKRRPKPYAWLTAPRQVMRKRLLDRADTALA